MKFCKDGATGNLSESHHLYRDTELLVQLQELEIAKTSRLPASYKEILWLKTIQDSISATI